MHKSTITINRGQKTLVPRVDTAPHDVETPTWGSQSQRHPGKMRFHPRIRNPSIHLQPRQTGDDNVGPPGRCRPPRCGKPNLALIAPIRAHPQNKNAFLTSAPINRGRKRLSPRTTPPRTVWKPQLRAHHCLLGFVKPAISIRWGQEGSASLFTMIYSN